MTAAKRPTLEVELHQERAARLAAEARLAELERHIAEACPPWWNPLAPEDDLPEVPTYETQDDTPQDLLRAPFTWFGGKRRAASLIWDLIGTGDNAPRCYCEPFAGSLAALLGRPEWRPALIETVNDKDAALALVWRSIAADPDAVAHFADWPVNEADLHARHRWIIRFLANNADKIRNDPEFIHSKFAGWWLWGINCWIGAGWGIPRKSDLAAMERAERMGDALDVELDAEGDDLDAQDIPRDPHKLNLTTAGTGTHRRHVGQLPYVHGDDAGRGVHSTLRRVRVTGQRESMGNVSRGLEPRRVHVAGNAGGYGVHRARLSDGPIPNITPTGSRIGVHRSATMLHDDRPVPPIFGITAWMRALAARLRRVRVCCGDWSRVVTMAVLLGDTNGHQIAGVFLDPPYDKALRHKDCYREDAHGVAADVRAWCEANGDNPRLRIVLAGYEGEHNALEALGWRKYEWRAHGGFGLAGQGRGRANRDMERLWASPACLDPNPAPTAAPSAQGSQLALWGKP